MKQNKRVDFLQRLRLGLKRLTSLNRRSAIAATTAVAAVLLIVGGIAFAGQGSSGPQTINQAASLFHSASPSGSNSTLNESPAGSSNAQSNDGTNPSSNNSLPTPTTIIGPGGQTIVVPPLTTSKPDVTTPNTSDNNPTKTTTPNSTPVTNAPTTAPTTPQSTPVTTAPRPVSTNGPATPSASVTVTASSPEDPTVNLKVTGADSDGYVTSITVDWNDGSSPDMETFSLDSCSDPESSSHTFNPSHNYNQAGTYNIGVTVTSMNCTGDTTQAQQAIAATAVVSGGSEPTTTEPDQPAE